MNLLWLAEVEPDPDAGASGTEVRTIEALRALGCVVDALWAQDFPRRIRHGNLHYLLESPHGLLHAARRHFDSSKHEAVVFNQPHGFRLAGWLRHHYPAVPAVHKSHGIETHVRSVLEPWRERGPRRPLSKRIASAFLQPLLDRHMRLTARYASGHLVSSSACASFLRCRHGVASERMAVIPQAPLDAFITAPRAAWTAERGKRLLFVGQFAFVKGGDLLARVWNRLARSDSEIRLTWVCGAEHHACVRTMLDPVALERTDLLPWMPQAELRAVYDRHGIFLWPSYFEGFGKAFLEAMARGLCVVATNQGGAMDIIRNGETGWLVEIGDEAGFEAAVRRALQSQTTSSMGDAAATVAGGFTWQRSAGLVLAALREWKMKSYS